MPKLPPKPSKPWNKISSRYATELKMKRARMRRGKPRYKKLGVWVRAIRSSLKMNQEEFSEKVGVSILSIRRWECGWGFFPQPKHLVTLNEIAVQQGLKKMEDKNGNA